MKNWTLFDYYCEAPLTTSSQYKSASNECNVSYIDCAIHTGHGDRVPGQVQQASGPGPDDQSAHQVLLHQPPLALHRL